MSHNGLLGVVVLAAWIAGCGDPWTEVLVTVRVSPEIQAAYSSETRGAVTGRLDAGSFGMPEILHILCEPTQETVEIVSSLGGMGCRGEGRVWAWVEEAEPIDDPPDCDLEEDLPYHYRGRQYGVPPPGAPQASAPVFEGVDDLPCRGGDDSVTLTLEYP